MPAERFVVPADLLTVGGELELPHDVAHQARDVLRLGPGAALALLDGAGGEWPATITTVSRAGVHVWLAERQDCIAEPRTRVILCLGVLKAAKLEWALQKGTELGVAAFVPLLCERAVAGAQELGAAKRERWRRILVEATEQCGRARVPHLGEPCSLAQAFARLPADALALMPWEEEHATSLRAALATTPVASSDRAARDDAPDPAVYLFIGPEGGFSSGEVALARRHDAITVTLGPRILRAETAALTAVALVMEACGELE
jgi:16S rRNA (uracil1498-N3)-methyltransferase